ncbi:Basic leucine zipper 43 [Bienertia sinuspersici]
MISNRESARRSRLRKRKQLENLQSQVLQLLAANHQLAEKLNLVMESNYEILQENSRLREEAICLRNELLMTSMKCDPLQEEDNGACIHEIRTNNNQSIISTSPNSITSSMDILR